ncbi:MAG: TonB-dependent receptor, partial [Kofleriaceae bacterium]
FRGGKGGGRSFGAGSFGARHARFHYGDDHGSLLSSTSLVYHGATGDYSFFDDGGTPLTTSDDRETVRRNNGFDQIELASRIGSEARDRAAGARVIWKDQGLPGSSANPALAAEMSTFDAILDGKLEVEIGDLTARQLAFAVIERQVMRDPMAELGLGAQDRGYLTLSGGASTTWLAALGPHLVTAGLELRGDRFRDSDRDGGRADLVGTRGSGAILGAFDLALGELLVVTPAVRLEAMRTAPTPMTEGPDAFADIPPRWDTIASPRLTARALVAPDVALKASFGRYVRLPTLLELFGDRGTIVGSPELRAERGYSTDAGAVWAPGKAYGQSGRIFDRIFVQGALFATRARDTIALISTAGFVARAQNIGATQSYGGELIASGRIARTISLTASYTRLVTQNRSSDDNLDGKAVPRTPGHLLYARVDASYRRASAWFDAAVQTTSFLDQANYARVPGRVLAGTGVRVEVINRLGVSLGVENLAGTRVVALPPDRAGAMPIRTALADLAGYPLPGRTFYLSLDWTY